jgi:hypothetical protein
MYLSYRRLLERGLKPRWLLVELSPFILVKEGKRTYTTSLVAPEFSWFQGIHEPEDLAVEYARARIFPWVRLQMPIIRRFAPQLATWPANAVLDGDYDRLGGIKFEPHHIEVHGEAVAERLRDKAAASGAQITTFVVGKRSDRALRVLLELCRENGTRVALLFPPESPAFCAMYSEMAYQQAGHYGSQLAAQYGLPLIDARGWLEEGDFFDGHHATYSGQAKFTDRLGLEFLTRWVAHPK